MIRSLSGNKNPIITGRPTDDESKTGDEQFEQTQRDKKDIKRIAEMLVKSSKKRSKNSYLKLIVLVLLALGGGSLYYLMKKPSKKKKKRRKRKK